MNKLIVKIYTIFNFNKLELGNNAYSGRTITSVALLVLYKFNFTIC